MTNYEKIKAMSVEEMADFICGIYDVYVCNDGIDDDCAKFICGISIPDYDEALIKEYLESEVEKDG